MFLLLADCIQNSSRPEDHKTQARSVVALHVAHPCIMYVHDFLVLSHDRIMSIVIKCISTGCHSVGIAYCAMPPNCSLATYRLSLGTSMW